MDAGVEEIVSGKVGLKTTGPELKNTLEKTGRTIRDVNGLDKLDILNLIVEQIKEKIECRGRMQLRLSDLNVLLQREGLSSEATAQDAIKQVLKLRCSQLARLGTYSLLPTDDAFTQALMVIPSHEIDNCFAIDDSPACDEGRYVPVSAQPPKRASTPPLSPQEAPPKPTVHDQFCKGSFAASEYSASESPSKPLPEFGSPASRAPAEPVEATPKIRGGGGGSSYADLEAKVVELQSRLDNAETRASLAEERAKVAMLQALLEKAEARTALAEARADALEARLAASEGRCGNISPGAATRHSAKPGTRPEGTSVPVGCSSTRSMETSWQWDACKRNATVPEVPVRSWSPPRSAAPGAALASRREAFAPKVRAKPPPQEIKHRPTQLQEESVSGRGSPTYNRHPGNPSIPGRPLFQQLVNF